MRVWAGPGPGTDDAAQPWTGGKRGKEGRPREGKAVRGEYEERRGRGAEWSTVDGCCACGLAGRTGHPVSQTIPHPTHDDVLVGHAEQVSLFNRELLVELSDLFHRGDLLRGWEKGKAKGGKRKKKGKERQEDGPGERRACVGVPVGLIHSPMIAQRDERARGSASVCSEDKGTMGWDEMVLPTEEVLVLRVKGGTVGSLMVTLLTISSYLSACSASCVG